MPSQIPSSNNVSAASSGEAHGTPPDLQTVFVSRALTPADAQGLLQRILADREMRSARPEVVAATAWKFVNISGVRALQQHEINEAVDGRSQIDIFQDYGRTNQGRVMARLSINRLRSQEMLTTVLDLATYTRLYNLHHERGANQLGVPVRMSAGLGE